MKNLLATTTLLAFLQASSAQAKPQAATTAQLENACNALETRLKTALGLRGGTKITYEEKLGENGDLTSCFVTAREGGKYPEKIIELSLNSSNFDTRTIFEKSCVGLNKFSDLTHIGCPR